MASAASPIQVTVLWTERDFIDTLAFEPSTSLERILQAAKDSLRTKVGNVELPNDIFARWIGWLQPYEINGKSTLAQIRCLTPKSQAIQMVFGTLEKSPVVDLLKVNYVNNSGGSTDSPVDTNSQQQVNNIVAAQLAAIQASIQDMKIKHEDELAAQKKQAHESIADLQAQIDLNCLAFAGDEEALLHLHRRIVADDCIKVLELENPDVKREPFENFRGWANRAGVPTKTVDIIYAAKSVGNVVAHTADRDRIKTSLQALRGPVRENMKMLYRLAYGVSMDD